MPATPAFPAPATDLCPACRGPVTAGRCAACGLALVGDYAGTIWWLDAELHRLAERRHHLLAAGSSAASWGPAGTPFPAPAVGVCPACDGPVEHARCGRCALALDGDAGSRLWLLDTELHRLSSQRPAVLASLRSAALATEGAGAPAAPMPLGAVPWPQSPSGQAEAGAPGATPAPAATPDPFGATPPAPPDLGSPPPPAEPSGDRITRRIQFVLLALGALCLVVAAIAFGAVAWNRLDAAGQGAVLAGATLAAGGAALLAHRRNLRATAEALFTVAAAGALVDIHAVHVGVLPDAPLWQVWAIGTAVVAGLAWAFDRVAPLVSARAVGLVVAQAPGVLLAVGPAYGDWSVGAAVLMAQAAVLLAIARMSGDRLRPRGLVAIPLAGAGLAWTAATATGLLAVVTGGWDGWFDVRPGAGLAVFAAGGLVALQVALSWREHDAVRDLASVVASTIAVVAAGLGICVLGGVEPAWLVMAGVGTVLVGIAAVVPTRWRPAPAVVGLMTAGPASLGALAGIGDAMRALGFASSGSGWQAGLADPTRSLVGSTLAGADLRSAALVLLAPVVIAGLAWWRGVARLAAAVTLASSVILGALLVPLAAGTPVWLAVLVPLLLGLAAATVAGLAPPSRPLALPAGVALLGLAGTWAGVSSVATVAALGLVLAVAVGLAWVGGRRADAPAALAATVAALGALVGLAATVAALQGATLAEGWLVVSVVLCVATGLGWWAAVAAGSTSGPEDLAGPLLRRMGHLIEAVALAVHLLALAVVSGSDVVVTSWLLLAGAVTLAVHATRTERRILGWGAAAEAMAFLWLRLAVAEVATVEAYTLPLAVVLLLAGAWALRADPERTSWDSIGPGLALGLAPTVVLSVSQPGAVRPLAVAVAGAIVLLVGLRLRLQAALTLGCLAVATVAFRQLLPAAHGLPPFLVFGAIGIVLLAVGATFEQRRRDLVDLRGRFESLR